METLLAIIRRLTRLSGGKNQQRRSYWQKRNKLANEECTENTEYRYDDKTSNFNFDKKGRGREKFIRGRFMAVSFQKYPALIAPGKASGLRGLLKGPVPVKNDIKNRKRGKFPESNPPLWWRVLWESHYYYDIIRSSSFSLMASPRHFFQNSLWFAPIELEL